MPKILGISMERMMVFTGSSVNKEPACSAEEPASRVRKIPWKRKWQPLQNPCLRNSMDRGA